MSPAEHRVPRLSRRALLAGAALAGAALAGCARPDSLLPAPLGAPRPPAAWPDTAAPHWRALSRLTFGPRPEELERAAAIGLEGWVEEQLAPAALDDAECERRLARLDTPSLDLALVNEIRPENLRSDLRAAALTRAVFSRRQLYELMVDFWSDHLSVFIEKERVGELKVIDDREVIRPHALGRFADLLWASMRSPAMLIYLDNQQNRAGRPNENYARELLELHTLGVHAGYTQGDVQELARCLTGWTVDEEGLWRGAHTFDAAAHDDGPKQLLGVAIAAGGGARDAERVHALLVEHPACARFIAHKLARRLTADEPSPGLVERAAAAFRRSGGAITALLWAILRSPEFAAAPPRMKRPLHLVAGAMRQLGAESDGGPAVQSALEAMGQPLFGWPTPDGFPDRDAAWSAALLPRWRFAHDLAAGALAGTRVDLPGLLAASGARDMAKWLDRAAALLLGAPLPRPAAATLLAALGPELSAERAGLAVATLVASPQYQYR